ncbi:hypothetical protein NEOLEDRAFT_1152490 [Neolentinus lepideus HHB14362 ss-1]|uniref:Uncharacterized protein n=1 Tax=Neolentinus lepideus HHB14362 ss-1 TaxID=1314782 RepID=A0A165MQN1_9AGAM|nr:hypothetical protein NEOLEDRAFT_1152490 [Neolentinus lepideus HHB14362 ss-1]
MPSSRAKIRGKEGKRSRRSSLSPPPSLSSKEPPVQGKTKPKKPLQAVPWTESLMRGMDDGLQPPGNSGRESFVTVSIPVLAGCGLGISDETVRGGGVEKTVVVGYYRAMCNKVVISYSITREQEFIEATSRITSFNVMSRILSSNADAYEYTEVILILILILIHKLGFRSSKSRRSPRWPTARCRART